MHGLGLRRVLDELEDLAAIHHRARRQGQVPAHLELALIDLARHAEIVGEIVDEILQSVEQALAACLGDPLQGAGIAEQRIGGRKGFGEQLQHEARALAILVRGVGAIEYAGEHVAPRDESLHEALVVAAFLPDDMAEAPVARIGGDFRTPHGDLEQFAREGEILFDQHLGIERHQPQQAFARG